jgi:dihydrodipicolinate synthase/N-acetylneuraminate lyase
MKSSLKGILPAIISPCNEKDVFLEDTFSKLAISLYREGVNGLYVCGATGDCFNMRLEERKRAAELAVAVSKKCGGSVIVHVGTSNSRDSMELAEHAANAGADAVSCIPPTNRNQAQLLQYYHDVARAARIPVLIYHLPALSSQNLSLESLLQLLDIPGVVGLKLSNSDLFLLRRLLLARPDIVVFIGNDELLCLAQMYGAHGGIGMTYNLFPKLFVNIYKAMGTGNLSRALELQHCYLPFLDLAVKYGIFSVFDYLMREQGYDSCSFRRPRQLLDKNTSGRLMKELEPVLANISDTLTKR